MGSSPASWPFVYQCACGQRNSLTALEFNVLPLLNYSDYEADLPKKRESPPAQASFKERTIPISGSRNSKTGEIMGRLIPPAPPPAAPKIAVQRVPLSDARKHVPPGSTPSRWLPASPSRPAWRCAPIQARRVPGN
jgi:hypothetical protein